MTDRVGWSRADALALIGLGGLLTGVYAPVIGGHYLLSDDYAWLSRLLQGQPLGGQMMQQGRPLYTWLLRLVFPLSGSISGMWRVRLVGFLLLLLAVALFYASARRVGFSGPEAWFGGAMVGLLPAFQVSVFFATAFPYPLAVALAAVAFWLCDCTDSRSALWSGLAAWVVLSAAMLVYQTAATAFVAFLALAWLGRPDVRPRVGVPAAVYAGACAFAYLAVRVLGADMARAQLATDLVGKVRWFLAEPAVAALDLFKLRPSLPLAVGVGVVMVAGLGFWLRRRALKGWWLALLVPLSYLPNLVIAENWFSYRTLIGASTLIVVFALAAVRGWARELGLGPGWRLAALGVGCAAAVTGAVRHLSAFVVRPQSAELAALERSLDGFNGHRVCLVPATESSTLAPFVRSDEFGRPSTSAPWARADAVVAVLRSRDPDARIPQVTEGACPDAVGALTVDVDSALRTSP